MYYMCVCVYIYMYTYTYVCMFLCVYICTYLCYKYIHTYIHMYIYICMYVCVFASKSSWVPSQTSVRHLPGYLLNSSQTSSLHHLPVYYICVYLHMHCHIYALKCIFIIIGACTPQPMQEMNYVMLHCSYLNLIQLRKHLLPLSPSLNIKSIRWLHTLTSALS